MASPVCCTNPNSTLSLTCPSPWTYCSTGGVCPNAYVWYDVCTMQVWVWVVIAVVAIIFLAATVSTVLCVYHCGKRSVAKTMAESCVVAPGGPTGQEPLLAGRGAGRTAALAEEGRSPRSSMDSERSSRGHPQQPWRQPSLSSRGVETAAVPMPLMDTQLQLQQYQLQQYQLQQLQLQQLQLQQQQLQQQAEQHAILLGAGSLGGSQLLSYGAVGSVPPLPAPPYFPYALPNSGYEPSIPPTQSSATSSVVGTPPNPRGGLGLQPLQIPASPRAATNGVSSSGTPRQATVTSTNPTTPTSSAALIQPTPVPATAEQTTVPLSPMATGPPAAAAVPATPVAATPISVFRPANAASALSSPSGVVSVYPNENNGMSASPSVYAAIAAEAAATVNDRVEPFTVSNE